MMNRNFTEFLCILIVACICGSVSLSPFTGMPISRHFLRQILVILGHGVHHNLKYLFPWVLDVETLVFFSYFKESGLSPGRNHTAKLDSFSVSLHSLNACRTISQIPQCIRQISFNAPFCNRNVHHFVTEMCTNVHISVTKWCIVGIWNWCIVGFVSIGVSPLLPWLTQMQSLVIWGRL